MPRRGGYFRACLTEPEQHQVAQWLGEFISPARIPLLIKEQFGKRVCHQWAYEFQRHRKWQGYIDRYRQQWIVKLDVPISFKKFRLEKLQRCIARLEATELHVPMEHFERRMLKLLDAARLEMEESKPSETTYFFTNINQYTDAELLQRRAELVKRIQEFRWPTTRRITHDLGDGRESSAEAGNESGEAGSFSSEPAEHPNGGGSRQQGSL